MKHLEKANLHNNVAPLPSLLPNNTIKLTASKRGNPCRNVLYMWIVRIMLP